MDSSASIIIKRTQAWLREVVIGFGFCPFAAKPFLEEKIRYRVISGQELHTHPQLVVEEVAYLQAHPEIETSLIIFEEAHQHFGSYWRMFQESEKRNKRKGFEGIFQLASFHPEYVFGDAQENDAANFTNRSPYPMIHIIREESLSKAIQYHPDPEGIPERNIAFAREKGLEFMQLLHQKFKMLT